MAEKKTYKSAMEELEEVLSMLESNELEVDELTAKAKRATELLKFCKEKLFKTTEEVNNILEKND